MRFVLVLLRELAVGALCGFCAHFHACSSALSKEKCFALFLGMKCHVPEISWHNRDPILSIDFQPSNDKYRRLATCGTDTHILIWFVILHHNGETSLEFRSDLNRHTKTVNTVRFSHNGELLASGDDDANVIIWKQVDKSPSVDKSSGDLYDECIENKEHWVAQKVLRGHIDDVCDICWSPDNTWLLSGSVDNSAIIWNVEKAKKVSLLNDNKGFVQGVTWDPRDAYFATLSSDRSLRIFKVGNKKVAYKVLKAVIPHEGLSDKEKATRLFYDDTLKSYCRRLAFSPDGELLVTPCGIIEQDSGRVVNTVYIFARSDLSEPAYYLPIGEKPSLVIRFCPLFFKLQTSVADNDQSSIEVIEEPLISLPYRMVFAVATQKAILLYDTQHSTPFAHISNIHYTRLSDLTWSPDGRILAASSTDGYCSLITFGDKELGEVYDGPLPYKDIVENSSDSPSGSKSSSPSEPKNNATKKRENNIFKSGKRKTNSMKLIGAAKLPASPSSGKVKNEVIIIDDEEDALGNKPTLEQFHENGRTELRDKEYNGVQSEQGPQATSDDTKQSGTISKTAETCKDESHYVGSDAEAQMCIEDGLVDATPQVLRALDLKVGRPKEKPPSKAQQCDRVLEAKTACEDLHGHTSGQDHQMAVCDKNEDQKSPASSGASLEPDKQADHPKKAPRRVQLVTLSTKKS
ncbi:chromatin assembly factor 1, p105 subunit isoform X1 [Amblyomma americanum]